MNKAKAFLTIQQILAADTPTIESVPCPEWGGDVFVRTVSANKQDKFDARYQRNADGVLNLEGYRADMVAMCLCDDNGEFLNPSPSEVTALGGCNGAAVDRIFAVCQVLTGNGPSEKDTEKNSERSAAENDSG